MKGMVFTEFLELVEDRFGADMVDTIIERADLPNGGAYTAVGTYDHAELVRLVQQLSLETNTEVSTLIKGYGEHLFPLLAKGHPGFIDSFKGCAPLFRAVHDVIHVEVKKLYPEAELPSFACEQLADGRMVMHYRSARGLADLAEGLIRGCATYYGEAVGIEREDLSEGCGTDGRFLLDTRPEGASR